MTDQRFKSETHGLCLRRCPASRLGFPEELFIDIEGLLHTTILTILVRYFCQLALEFADAGNKPNLIPSVRLHNKIPERRALCDVL